MNFGSARNLTRWKKVFLLLLVLIVVGKPNAAFSGVNSLTCSEVRIVSLTAAGPTFAVASVRRNPKPTFMRLEFTVDGFVADGVTLRQLIQRAYGLFGQGRLIGEPPWVDSDYFDVKAKVDDSFANSFANLSMEQRESMLQALLAERFGLVIHRAMAERPVYDLELAEGGPKLQPFKPQESSQSNIKGVHGLVVRSGSGILGVEGFSMDDLAILLESLSIVDKPVVNETALSGYYNFSLHWTPEDLPSRAGAGSQGARKDFIPTDPGSSSTIFKEIQKQVGLKLKPSKGQVKILFFDRAEAPTAN